MHRIYFEAFRITSDLDCASTWLQADHMLRASIFPDPGVTLIDKGLALVTKPAIVSGCDPIPFRTWKSNLMSLLCY